jgi:hypothetical protein
MRRNARNSTYLYATACAVLCAACGIEDVPLQGDFGPEDARSAPLFVESGVVAIDSGGNPTDDAGGGRPDFDGASALEGASEDADSELDVPPLQDSAPSGAEAASVDAGGNDTGAGAKDAAPPDVGPPDAAAVEAGPADAAGADVGDADDDHHEGGGGGGGPGPGGGGGDADDDGG